jgi:SacI homology domain
VNWLSNRYIKRGSDEYGDVANFVETEQILVNHNTSQIRSFVQIRGSIPLFWSQPETWKLKPSIVPADNLEINARALKSHLVDLYESYKLKKVYFVNLIDKKGGQGRLGTWLLAAFYRLLTGKALSVLPPNTFINSTSNSIKISKDSISDLINFNASGGKGSGSGIDPVRAVRLGVEDSSVVSKEDFSVQISRDDLRERHPTSYSIQKEADFGPATMVSRLLWFDYHAKCKGGQVSSIKEIFPFIRESLTSRNASYYSSDGFSRQESIIRTNCIDCLDRTNVVQVMIKSLAETDVHAFQR